MRDVESAGPVSFHNFTDLLEFLRDSDAGATVLSSKRFCEVVGIDPDVLTGLAEVHGKTSDATSAFVSVQCFIRSALRVLRAASDLSGDLERAISWFRNESLTSFSHKTAERLVADGRVEDVIRYVVSLDAGVVG